MYIYINNFEEVLKTETNQKLIFRNHIENASKKVS